MAQIRKPRLLDIDSELGEDRIEAPEGHRAAHDAAEVMTTAFAGAGDAARKAFETARSVQEEFTHFCQQRLRANGEAAGDMMKCKSWPELLETQQAWAKSAAEQYGDYLKRVLGMMRGGFPTKED